MVTIEDRQSSFRFIEENVPAICATHGKYLDSLQLTGHSPLVYFQNVAKTSTSRRKIVNTFQEKQEYLSTFSATASSFGKLATVYQCELFALHMASIWINENLVTTSIINLFSDSQASLLALTSTSISSRLVLDIADQLNTLGTSHKVELRWVPGHEGVHGNDLADELAREGSSSTPIGPEPFLPLSEGIINTHIKDYLFNLHIKKYKQVALSDKGKTPLTFFLNKYRYKKINITGTHIRWLTWLLSGHTNSWNSQQGFTETFYLDRHLGHTPRFINNHTLDPHRTISDSDTYPGMDHARKSLACPPKKYI